MEETWTGWNLRNRVDLPQTPDQSRLQTIDERCLGNDLQLCVLYAILGSLADPIVRLG
jgi:hypothetical protein